MKNYLRADLYILCSTLVAAAGWIFSLKTLEGLPPLRFIGLRFLIAGLLVAAFAHYRDGRFDARRVRLAAVPGALLACAMTLWILGLRFSSNISVGAFICSLGNIVAPVFGALIFGWRLPAATRLALALATLGMAFLFLENGRGLTRADWLFFASAIASALYLAVNTRLTASIPIATLTATQLATAGLANLAISTFFDPATTAAFGPATLGWLAASILIATSLRFFLQVSGQSAAPLSHTALLMCLEPLWTSLVAALWLATALSRFQMIGCGLIFAALLVNGRPARRKPTAGA